MATQIPLKVLKNGGNTCGLAEFSTTDSLAVSVGGTGLTTQGICAFAQPGIQAVACKTTYIGICAGKSEGAADENTYVGYGAGQNVTTGCYHTIIGSNAGDAITTCSSSVLIGYNAGTAITFGDRNTAIGTSAGAAITTAIDNTLVGYISGCVTTGNNNTGLGACVLALNTVGVDNVAIGSFAGESQVAAGCNNTYIGSQAGVVALCRDNTLVGAYAGKAQTTATCNVMLGGCVGYGVVGGAGNVYLGYKSGLVNTSGNDNVFIGKSSGAASTASCCLIIGNGTCDIITGSFATPLISMIGCVGIGNSAPGTILDVLSGTAGTAGSAAPNLGIFTGPKATFPLTATLGNVAIMSNDAQAIDNGAALTLGGRYLNSSTVQTAFAAISGHKENGTSNNLDGYLALHTNEGGTVGEKLRITSAGDVGIGTTPHAATGKVDVLGANAVLDSPGVMWLRTNNAQAVDLGGQLSFGGYNDDGASAASAWASISGRKENGTTGNSAGYLAFATAANAAAQTEKMRIDSSGNVGIGTASPSSILDAEIAARNTVYDASDWKTWSDIHVVNPQNTSGGVFPATGISFAVDANDYDNGAAGIAAVAGDADSEHALAFIIRPNGAVSKEAMRIDSSGNVGIGLTAPSVALDVLGSLKVAPGAASGIHQGRINALSSNDNTSMPLETYSTTNTQQSQLLLQKSASGTIGTLAETAADENLGAIKAFGADSGDATGFSSAILFEQDAASGTEVPGRIVFQTATSSVAPADRMTIDSSGKLGIGTTSAKSQLDIVGSDTGRVLAFQRSGAAAASRTFGTYIGGTADCTLIFTAGSDCTLATAFSSAIMSLESSGNIGIGTTAPATLLDVCGSVQLGSAATKLKVYSDASYSGVYNGSSLTSDESMYMGGDTLYWYAAGNNVMIACGTTGNIGIGTGSPATMLHLQAGGITLLQGSANVCDGIKWCNGGTSMCQVINAGGNFVMCAPGQSILMQDGGGKIGIGTTSPLNCSMLTIMRDDLSTGTQKGGLITLSQNGYVCDYLIESCSAIYMESPLDATGLFIGTDSVGCGGYIQTAEQAVCWHNRPLLLQPLGGSIQIGCQTAPDGQLDIISSGNINQQFNCLTHASGTGTQFWPQSTRAASSSYQFFYATSGGTSDAEFWLKGDGNAYADGTWNDNGADYAEFFESTTDIALDQGRTVVLEGCKVRYYDAAAGDTADDIFGVVRPADWSKNSMVIGNTAWNMHHDKYLTDDWGVYILSDVPVKSWTDSETNKEYAVYENPPPGVDIDPDYNWNTAPANATITCQAERTLNPNYNYDCDYVNREDRPEWNIIGLLGQVHVCTGQTVNSRWLKMHDISCNVQLWLIR